jgi:hypothetical protein
MGIGQIRRVTARVGCSPARGSTRSEFSRAPEAARFDSGFSCLGGLRSRRDSHLNQLSHALVAHPGGSR